MSTPHFEHLAIPTRYIPPSNAITGSHTGRELSAKAVQFACLKAARPHRKMCQFLRGGFVFIVLARSFMCCFLAVHLGMPPAGSLGTPWSSGHRHV